MFTTGMHTWLSERGLSVYECGLLTSLKRVELQSLRAHGRVA